MVTGLIGRSGLDVTSPVMMEELKDGDIVQILSHYMEGEHVLARPQKRNNATHKYALVGATLLAWLRNSIILIASLLLIYQLSFLDFSPLSQYLYQGAFEIFLSSCYTSEILIVEVAKGA